MGPLRSGAPSVLAAAFVPIYKETRSLLNWEHPFQTVLYDRSSVSQMTVL